jgi:antitoxin component YwqK of YwqJK toxin-antitoxin module
MEMEELKYNFGYYKSGNIKWKCGRFNNKIHGSQNWWFENGNKADEFKVINDMRIGIYKKWNIHGARYSMIQWKLNQYNGIRIKFNYEF